MNRKRIKSDDNIDVNKIIGANLRFCRQMAGKNQTRLGAALGNVKFQQIQKYESGRNGMSAYRLWKAAQYLQVPMDAFFDPNYIASMRSVHTAKALTAGPKPKGFFDVYTYQKDYDDQLHTDLYQAKIKGQPLTKEEEKFLERFDDESK